MTIVLINSSIYGYVVWGVFDNEDTAYQKISQYREETKNTWVDSHYFQVYSGKEAEHFLSAYD